jgi:hypothetical protein
MLELESTKACLLQQIDKSIRDQSTKTAKEITAQIKKFEKESTFVDSLCGTSEKFKTIGEFIKMFWAVYSKDTLLLKDRADQSEKRFEMVSALCE